MTKVSAALPARSLRHRPHAAYYSVLGPWRARAPERIRSSIVVAGSPRSGTTWVAATISKLTGWPLMDEPTKPPAVPELWEAHEFGPRPYRDPASSDPELDEDLERLFTGTYLGAGIVRRSVAIDRSLWRRDPIVSKVINVNLLLPYLGTHLPWLRTVLVVRHPLAVVASQQSRVGSAWTRQHTLNYEHQAFMAAHPEYRGPVTFETVAECLVTGWALEQAWLRDQKAQLGDLVTIRYEAIRSDLAGQTQRLAEELAIPAPSAALIDEIARPSRSVVDASVSTLDADAHSGWRSRYDEDELAVLRAILERYDYPFYGPDEL